MHEVLDAVRYKSDQEAIRQGRKRAPWHEEDANEDWMSGVFNIDFD